jgi:lipopolysaccharide transport system ATP-binding protein
MSVPAIRASGLSKRFRIGQRVRYKSLRESIQNAVTAPFRRGDRATETIWALRDVSFEVAPGEVVGVIGRNGAGKSTLLKVLSRITEPTEGRLELRGRVGSLLEIGTGFHLELTGSENIYLAGAILGMRRAEIERRFEEIVAFSEIERFLDTPVKHYSTGMYLRLAFAVAAHLEPEILLIDEVLAVGDAAFRKKCVGKMDDVARGGRAVVFVSHDMAAVQQLCRTGIVLDGGRVGFTGPIEEAIGFYLQKMRRVGAIDLSARTDRQGSNWLKLTRVTVCDRQGSEVGQALSGQDLWVRLHYVSEREVRDAEVDVAFNVRDANGFLLANLNSTDTGQTRMDIHRRGYFECRWPRLNLRAGSYDGACFCAVNREIVDWLQSAFVLEVEDGDFFGTGRLRAARQGAVLVDHSWSSHEDTT